MVEFNEGAQESLIDLFQLFNQRGVRYVVPRGHEELPEAVPGGDIDILIENEDFETAVSCCRNAGFGRGWSVLDEIIHLSKVAISKPKKALSLLKNSPREVFDLIQAVFTTKTSRSIGGEFREVKFQNDQIHIHLFDQLSHTSPMNQKSVRINPELVDKMLARRRSKDPIWVPHPVDELAHILCRGIFDYGGDFPVYYVNLCKSLKSEVLLNEEDREKLREVLELLFFHATPVVMNAVENDDYNSIRDRLLTYDEY